MRRFYVRILLMGILLSSLVGFARAQVRAMTEQEFAAVENRAYEPLGRISHRSVITRKDRFGTEGDWESIRIENYERNSKGWEHYRVENHYVYDNSIRESYCVANKSYERNSDNSLSVGDVAGCLFLGPSRLSETDASTIYSHKTIFVGRETVDGKPLDVYEKTTVATRRDSGRVSFKETMRLWINEDNKLVKRFMETFYEQKKPQSEETELYEYPKDIEINAPIVNPKS